MTPHSFAGDRLRVRMHSAVRAPHRQRPGRGWRSRCAATRPAGEWYWCSAPSTQRGTAWSRESVSTWCSSFGHVATATRMPPGPGARRLTLSIIPRAAPRSTCPEDRGRLASSRTIMWHLSRPFPDIWGAADRMLALDLRCNGALRLPELDGRGHDSARECSVTGYFSAGQPGRPPETSGAAGRCRPGLVVTTMPYEWRGSPKQRRAGRASLRRAIWWGSRRIKPDFGDSGTITLVEGY